MDRYHSTDVRVVICVILLSVFTSCLAQRRLELRSGLSSFQSIAESPEREPVEIEQPEPFELEQPKTPEVPEFEPPEEPCPCNFRCCFHSLEPRRPISILEFNVPALSSFSCCGCVECHESYFYPAVSQPDTSSMLTSFVIRPIR